MIDDDASRNSSTETETNSNAFFRPHHSLFSYYAMEAPGGTLLPTLLDSAKLSCTSQSRLSLACVVPGLVAPENQGKNLLPQTSFLSVLLLR